MAESKKIVIVSSTARDLPEHRKEVMDACLRQGMFPQMMEHLPAADADAIDESLRIVGEADIYLGIFAHRYGYVPKGHDISITEMEYNRAIERGIPRLIFLTHKEHLYKEDDFETGEGAQKLKALKERLGTERVVNYFKSPAELRANVIDSLSHYREHDVTAFHYISDIPKPPEIYVAHPYTLLQTRDLVGRQQELNLLTDWVAKPGSEIYQARIFNFVAIGGMGKSALTWKWFNDIAPNEMKPMSGRMWWSFYESDATFENFIIRALAYVTGYAREDIEKNTKLGEREEILLATLDRKPFLLVLDGLERILIAYARMDANRLADDDLDQRTANAVAGDLGLPESAAQSFTGQQRLRKTADLRAGDFLRKLARVRASRILVSTRLYPADLQNVAGQPVPGSFAHFIRGLCDDDALNLWRIFGVSGSRDELLRLFHVFDSHPLLIQALAGEIAHDHRAAGDFDRWRSNHPDFNPFSLPLVSVRSHILEFALRGLNESSRKSLYTIAAFRMPASYDTLVAVLVGDGKIFLIENALDAVLTALEDRGLLGWDKRSSRYDLHPIVRGVAWNGLSKDVKQEVYEALHAHFELIPEVNKDEVSSVKDLTASIELYNTLIGLDRYADAFNLFNERLNKAMLFRLSASQQGAELMELLFPDGLEALPRLNKPRDQSSVLRMMATAYELCGRPGLAVPLLCRANDLDKNRGSIKNLCIGLCNKAGALLCSGALCESEIAGRQALCIARNLEDAIQEAYSMGWLGWPLAARGKINDAIAVTRWALQKFADSELNQAEGSSSADLAEYLIWQGDYSAAKRLADHAWELAKVRGYEGDFVRAARMQGIAALELNDRQKANDYLHQALTRAREVKLIEAELPSLIGLGELSRRQGRLNVALELLDQVWEATERGPYPLFHADALNVLTQIERDAGNTDKAVEAATEAYRKAWCDGPPFAYHWGLEAARKHLAELNAAEPTDLPPFDESKYEPMPDVEIDPPDLPVEPDSTDV